MGGLRTVQNSFVSGEISPALYGRHDLKAYFNGAARIENFTVRKAGGLRKRAGTDVLLDLTDFPGCRLVPFFYSRDTSFLLLFQGGKVYVIGKNAAGAYDFLKRYTGAAGGSGYYLFGTGADWEIYAPDTQYADKDLPGLKWYQAGDTVFLTCPGYQACRIRRLADLSWSVSYMTAAVTVPTPGALTAAPSGFHDVSSGYPASRTDYALFAVKGGVVSAPRKVSASVTLPWIAGAQVSLAFTPDLASGVEGYYIAKKSGAFYGMLAEMWPTREAVGLTAAPAKTYASSGVPSAGWAASWLLSSDHAADLRAADPNAKASREIKMPVSKYAVHVPKGADGLARAVFYKSGATFNVGKVRVFFGARTSDAARQNAVGPDYSHAPPRVIVEHLAGTAWAADFDGAAPGAASTGYSEITIAYAGTTTKVRVSVVPGSASDTGVVLRGIAVINRSAAYLTAGTWTLESSATAYASVGAEGLTDSASCYSSAYLDVNSDAEAADRDAYVERSCAPARYLKPHATPCALTLYDSGSGVMAAAVKLAAASHFAVNEIRIYPGAACAGKPLHTPGVLQTNTSNTAGCKILYTLNGSTWLKLDGTFSIADQYGENPVSIQIPETTASEIRDAAIGWGVELIAADASKPVLVRGAQFFVTTVASNFVDQNHTPGALVDAQTCLSPGDSDMDCEIVTVWQQRTALAASASLPFTLWFSQTGDLNNWYANRPMTDGDAFSVSIPATVASKILHLLSDRQLTVFTESGVYVVAGSDGEGFGYRTCRINRACGVGACGVAPVWVQAAALYVASDGRTLTELRYDLASDGLVPIDRSVLSAHLTETANVSRLAWQPAPDGLLWVLLDDGTLLSFTYLPEHEVFAWARHPLAGGACGVLDIVASGSVDETRAGCEGAGDVFLLVSAGGRVTLERLRSPCASDWPSLAEAVCLDRMQTVHNAAANADFLPAVPYPAGDALTAVSLETGEVRACVAGSESGIVNVSGAPVSGMWALGYPAAARVDTLRPELPDRNVQGIAKNVTDILIRVRRARGVSVRPSAGGLADVTTPAQAAAAGGRIVLYSGDFKVVPRGYVNTHGGITAGSADPWPAEILSLVQTVQMGEG